MTANIEKRLSMNMKKVCERINMINHETMVSLRLCHMKSYLGRVRRNWERGLENREEEQQYQIYDLNKMIIAREANHVSAQLSAVENMHYSQMIRFDNAEEASFSKLSISGIELMYEDANDSLCKLVTTARLSKLMIGSTNIKTERAIRLMDSWNRANHQLVKLDLSCCSLTSKYIMKLVTYETPVISLIIELNLEGNPLKQEVGLLFKVIFVTNARAKWVSALREVATKFDLLPQSFLFSPSFDKLGPPRAQQVGPRQPLAVAFVVETVLAATVAATRWLVAKAGGSYQPAAAFIILTRPFGAIMFDPPMHHLVLLSSNDGRTLLCDMSNSDELRHTNNTTLVPPRLPDTLPQVYHRRRPTLGLLILPYVSPFPPTIRRTARISIPPIEPNLAERARISAINLDDYQLDPVTPPPSPSSPFTMAAYQRMIAETDPTQREEALTETGQNSVPVPETALTVCTTRLRGQLHTILEDMDHYPNAYLEELEAFMTLWDVKPRVEESSLEALSVDELITQLRQMCEDAEDRASNAQEEARQKRKEALEEVIQRIYRNNN
ncbi:reverse transcriptase domain-containing protein [Tanacetum coccineum]|uniref:Reverse transcriptase domain-containing protein n=1 Tax=Tanacetum coccineum TaxID=301880 RepID=A0ABQ4XWH0_9ASTR